MWNDTETPLAYFISFRSYGTWVHGDKRGSIDRFHNRYGDPYLPPNEAWQRHNHKLLKTDPFILGQGREDRLKRQYARPVAFGNGICRPSTDYVLNGQGDVLPNFDEGARLRTHPLPRGGTDSMTLR